MAIHNADLSEPVPNEPDRRKQIVNLYRIGKWPREIASILGVSTSRVNQVLKEHTATHMKRGGTDGFRVELASEMDLIREHLGHLLCQTNEEGEPKALDWDTFKEYERIAQLQIVLLGVSSAGPIYAEGDQRRLLKRQRIVETYNEVDDDDDRGKR